MRSFIGLKKHSKNIFLNERKFATSERIVYGASNPAPLWMADSAERE